MTASLYIALPAFKQVNCSRTTASLMAFGRELLKIGVDWYFCDQSWPDIAELRNIQLTIWYDSTDADHMLFVDDDMEFDPVVGISMLAHNEPVVGVLYPKRTYPIQYVGQLLPPPFEMRDGFIRVHDIGGGLMMIRRDAVTAMLEKGAAQSDYRLRWHAAGDMLGRMGIKRIIRAFDKIETDTGALSEDKSFCKRHRDCGGEIWAAINHKITHVGSHGYSGRFADRISIGPIGEGA